MSIWMDRKNEFACSGPDNWKWGDIKGCGIVDKICHLFGHCIAVLAGYLIFQYNVWVLMLMSEIFGWLYEILWDKLICKHGASRFDIIANNVGMLFAVLIILVANLIGSYSIPRPLILGLTAGGFFLTFVYKVWKMRKRGKSEISADSME